MNDSFSSLNDSFSTLNGSVVTKPSLDLVTNNSIHLRSGGIHCYTNESYTTGVAEYCQKPLPFCCYDISGDSYCCKEDQIITIIKTSSTVFGSLFFWTLIIGSFFYFFVDFDSNELPPIVTPGESKSARTSESGFSKIFDPQKDETKTIIEPKVSSVQKTSERKTIIEPKVSAEQQKPTEVKSSEKVDDYKPAWGQYNQQPEKKSSQARIGFKQKQAKEMQSMESLKAKVNKPMDGDQNPNSKQTKSTQNFSQNVEKMKKSVNK